MSLVEVEVFERCNRCRRIYLRGAAHRCARMWVVWDALDEAMRCVMYGDTIEQVVQDFVAGLGLDDGRQGLVYVLDEDGHCTTYRYVAHFELRIDVSPLDPKETE